MFIKKQYKIILAIVISLVFTLAITKSFFFDGVPKINAEKISRTLKNIKDNITIFKNTFAYRMSSNKIDYNQVFTDQPASINFVAKHTLSPTDFIYPTEIIQPTIEPTIQPTIEPTIQPTIEPTLFKPTTHSRVIPSPTRRMLTPTKRPTRKPTRLPSLTPTEKRNPLFIQDPLNQPYYNPSKAYLCYTPAKFIEVYADDAPINSCYKSIKSNVDANLTSVDILGKTITVHKLAYPAFKAVANELKNFSGYKIKTAYAYVFRCNTAASTGDSWDVCQPGCVIGSHAFGIAVDINEDENCFGCSTYTMPMKIVDAFESYGFRWGGRYKSIFNSTIDAMHFEYMYDLCKDIK